MIGLIFWVRDGPDDSVVEGVTPVFTTRPTPGGSTPPDAVADVDRTCSWAGDRDDLFGTADDRWRGVAEGEDGYEGKPGVVMLDRREGRRGGLPVGAGAVLERRRPWFRRLLPVILLLRLWVVSLATAEARRLRRGSPTGRRERGGVRVDPEQQEAAPARRHHQREAASQDQVSKATQTHNSTFYINSCHRVKGSRRLPDRVLRLRRQHPDAGGELVHVALPLQFTTATHFLPADGNLTQFFNPSRSRSL